MRAIFYDLETSDSSPLGQILNFCFTVTDAELKVIDQFADEIRISRLQLPSPDAILVNRTNVLELQQRAKLNEQEAMQRIYSFISKYSEGNRDGLALIGFNSNSFDLNFLRTSFIRNGINPYFRALSRDLYHLCIHLYINRADFRERMLQARPDPSRPNLKLAHIASRLGILESAQTHNAADDVDLCILLAKELRAQYGVDIFDYNSYEPKSLLSRSAKQGSLLWQMRLNYEDPSNNFIARSAVCLLDHHERGALWIDLERFEKDPCRDSIVWFNREIKSFVAHNMDKADTERYQDLAHRAIEKFSRISLANYFEPLVCDIEAHIYKVGAASISDLYRAIVGQGDHKFKGSPDLKELYRRNRMANYVWGGEHDQLVRDELKAFALQRFGGKLVAGKISERDSRSGKISERDYYPSLQSRFERIKELKRTASSAQDLLLLGALEKFYLESDLVAVAGEALLGS